MDFSKVFEYRIVKLNDEFHQPTMFVQREVFISLDEPNLGKEWRTLSTLDVFGEATFRPFYAITDLVSFFLSNPPEQTTYIDVYISGFEMPYRTLGTIGQLYNKSPEYFI